MAAAALLASTVVMLAGFAERGWDSPPVLPSNPDVVRRPSEWTLTVEYAEGRVRLLHAGRESAAQTGVVASPGTVVSTGEADGRAVLWLSDGSRLELSSGSRMQMLADPALAGRVSNALELVQRLAKSEHVHQVFFRHAFRYWLGRNVTPDDAPTLQAAYRAYRDSGSSMNARIS